MWRNGRRCFVIVSRFEEPFHDARIAASRGDVEHRSNQKAHHVVQETVRADAEIEATGAFTPIRLVDNAVVIVLCRGSSLYGERTERVISDYFSRCLAKTHDVERTLPRELAISSERRFSLLVGSNQVTVAPGQRAVPRVKSSRISNDDLTHMSRGRTALSERRSAAAVHFSGTLTPAA